MLSDWTRIELATRLRTMNRVLDCIVPDSPTEAVDEAIEIALKAVGRQEMTHAVTILEEVVNTNPFWLRGYLLLATIYLPERPERRPGNCNNRERSCHMRQRPPPVQGPKVGRSGGADQRACRIQSHFEPCRTTQTI